MGRLLKIGLVLCFLTACSEKSQPVALIVDTTTVSTTIITTTSTKVPVRTVPTRASRKQISSVSVVNRPVSSVMSGDFWNRLANCESSNSNQPGGGYWQIIDSTWHQAGEKGSATQYSREYQLNVAKRWAARIHPNEGTRSGWPICWWVALRG